MWPLSKDATVPKLKWVIDMKNFMVAITIRIPGITFRSTVVVGSKDVRPSHPVRDR
jgi:hypothetical protein